MAFIQGGSAKDSWSSNGRTVEQSVAPTPMATFTGLRSVPAVAQAEEAMPETDHLLNSEKDVRSQGV